MTVTDMGLLSDNTKKVIKIVVRSTRSFNNTFRLFAANLSKDEELTEVVNFVVQEVTPDTGYSKQYEVYYTFENLIIGLNNLTVKILGEDEVSKTGSYVVLRNFPSDTESTCTYPNQFPNLPSNLSPANEETNTNRTIQLSWTCTDPEGDPLVYDVYFGKSESPVLVTTNQTATTFPSTGTMLLDPGAAYGWKVVAKDGYGIEEEFGDGYGMTEGDHWWFRAAYAPSVPYLPSPWNRQVETDPTNVTLSWLSGSKDGNPLIYHVYFGPTYSPEELPLSPVVNNYYNVGALANNTTYYWKVIVEDGKGNTVAGPKWKFTTKA